ncbi:MAG: hypothetical protein JSU04_09925 [Bdellovibrionales bacterium]|nr:hypothetical protein [Bdellovibrionales bacterium]
MKLVSLLAIALFLASCATNPNSATTTARNTETTSGVRSPSAATDLSGTYLGEGLYQNRTQGLRRPAMRIYFDRVPGESDSYYSVLVEYDQLFSMAAPYLASQKLPIANHVIGYLNNISTRISAYKVVPSQKAGSYEFHNLEVQNGQIVPAAAATMVLNLDPKNNSANVLAGANITGNVDGLIVFPSAEPAKKGLIGSIGDALNLTQLELATTVYKLGHLASTWRGNWNDLEGSYLSEYGKFKDGVLELYSANGQKKMRFLKSNVTLAKHFTNPKSAPIEGDFVSTEPVPKMYVLVPAVRKNTPSEKEMGGRIGLFLDVFDGSAPEAGSHLVTELAFTNPADPEDFMMYYEHPQHLKNVGVEPAKAKK